MARGLKPTAAGTVKARTEGNLAKSTYGARPEPTEAGTVRAEPWEGGIKTTTDAPGQTVEECDSLQGARVVSLNARTNETLDRRG